MAPSTSSCLAALLLPLVIIFCLTVATSAQFNIFAVPVRSPPPAPGRPIGRRTVKCTRKEFPFCRQIKALCPLECRTSCFMDCTLCKPVCNCDRPGAVCQDPRFIGGDGITFYFHGQKDRDFCLVTGRDLHINAHFIGKRVAGKRRDFTWVQSVGILFGRHRLLVGAGKTGVWDNAVDRLVLAFNGEPIRLPATEGAKWQCEQAPHVIVTRTRYANAVSVEAAGRFTINAVVIPITKEDSRLHGYNITDDDCFAHLDLRFKFYGLSDDVDGVLGQTYRKNYTSRVRVGLSMPMIGGEREFATSHIFSTDCAVSRFGETTAAVGDGVKKYGAFVEHPSMQCNSGGAGGRGVVCTR